MLLPDALHLPSDFCHLAKQLRHTQTLPLVLCHRSVPNFDQALFTEELPSVKQSSSRKHGMEVHEKIYRHFAGPIMGDPQSSWQATEEFLASLESYTPTIPDELTEHCLARSGFHCPDKRMTRLISLAAQKFIGEIASDSYQFCRLRQDKRPGKDKQVVLTTEDLAQALKEYGVHVRKPEYFADGSATPTAAINVQNTNKVVPNIEPLP